MVLKRIMVALLVLLLFATGAITVISLVRIPVDITAYREMLEAQASRALSRPVTVEGPVILTTSLWPYFELGGLRIGSATMTSTGDLLQMERARITVGLLPLLHRRLHIRQFAVDGLSLNLVRAEDGRVNWATEQTAPKTAATGAEPASNSEQPPFALAVDDLQLGNIALRFEDRAEAQVQTFHLHEAQGSAPIGEPMSLDMTGELHDEPYALSLTATTLRDFIAMTHTRVDLRIDIANTRFEFGGFTDLLGSNLRTELDMAIRGDRLDSLNRLLGVDLPPLEDYSLSAGLVGRPGQLELTGLQVRVGDSELSGRAMVDDSVQPPSASLDLVAKTLQLRDFDTGDWSPEPAREDDSIAAEPGDAVDKPAKPLTAEALRRLNARLSVSVENVLSGEDRFGGGKLQFMLQDGRLSIDPLELESDTQSLFARVSLKPDRQRSGASLRILAQNVDMGALIRLSAPESDVGGVLNIDMEVQSEAARFSDLLANASGYFDVSAVPENLGSGLVDLWAVNLLAAVVDSAVDSEAAPVVNCLLSRWSMEEGRMKARQLAVDTTRIRICGDGRIDFGERGIKLSAKPRAKRPEFFSLATPVKISGSFEDFGIGLKGGVLTVGKTAVGFVISPITTPLKRLLRNDLPADGADVCGLPIGPHSGKLDKLPGC